MRFWMAVVAVALLGVLAGTGLAGTPELSLYPLDRPPTADDWRLLPPLHLEARGGAMVDPGLAWRMDQSLTHTANPDCHHGPAAGGRIEVLLSGFWTPRHIYLRIVWDDRTENRTFRAWGRKNGGWVPTGEGEDGVSIAWGEDGLPCYRACHLTDWGFDKGVMIPQYRMTVADNPVPFWVWRVCRGRIFGEAEKGWFGTEKASYLTTGPRFRFNSRLGPDDPLNAFSESDGPLIAGSGKTLPGLIPVSRSTRFPVDAVTSSYRRGRWEVVLRRRLAVDAGEGISLDPGREVMIGISLFDDSLLDHHIVQESIRLKFVSPVKEES